MVACDSAWNSTEMVRSRTWGNLESSVRCISQLSLDVVRKYSTYQSVIDASWN